MEVIEVVIKIPKILYAQIQSDAEIMIYSGMRSWKGVLATLLRSVRNGTLLPKGHGRIADVDKMLDEMRATRTYDILFALERVKPILEADKE